MGVLKTAFLQPCLEPMPKRIGSKSTVNERIGNSQGQSRYHKTTNDDP